MAAPLPSSPNQHPPLQRVVLTHSASSLSPSQSLSPGSLLSVASFLASPTIRHLCFYWHQICTVTPQPHSPGYPLFSRWASNHPSKPQADGAALESFPGALAEPTASSAPAGASIAAPARVPARCPPEGCVCLLQGCCSLLCLSVASPCCLTPAAGMSGQPSLVAAWRMWLKPKQGLQGRPQARNREDPSGSQKLLSTAKWGPLPWRLLPLAAPLCFRSAVLLFPPSASELQEKGEKAMVSLGPGWLEPETEDNGCIFVFFSCSVKKK